MKLELVIESLLYDNDCVIVPEFGAFIANIEGAHYQPLSSKIHPPRKRIGFNAKLKQNDGLLANHIASSQGMSYEDALRFIQSEQVQWQKALSEGKRLRIQHVGVLYADANAALRFDPSHEKNFLLDAFGLSPVHIKEIKKEKKLADKLEREIQFTNRAKPEIEKIKYRIPRLVYAFMAFPFFLYLLWLSTQTNLFREERFLFSDLNPFNAKICEIYKVRNLSPEKVLIPAEEGSFIQTLKNSTEANFAGVSFEEETIYPNEKRGFFVRFRDSYRAVAESTKVKLAEPNYSLKYHLISGCFSEKDNADRMVRKMLKAGFNASIIDQRGGLYRVSAASFAKKEEALATIDKIRQDYVPGTWLLVK